jgi:hypothetical protein
MTHYITHLKDAIGQNYLGIKIPNESLQLYLNELKEVLGEEDYNLFTENQQRRDSGEYHITVINVADYNKLTKELGMDKFVSSLDSIFKYPIDDLKFMGIGTATRNENRAYFIVCDSDKLTAVRNRYELNNHDFHITLGFLHRDVFGVRKNEVMKKRSKFLQLLAQEFLTKETWNFIKNIENYNSDPKAEVIPLQITDTFVKVKVDGDFMDVTYLEDGEKFWIATKYSADKDLPRLPETEISRILKKR